MDIDRSSPTGHWVTSWPVMLWAALKIFCHVLHLALLHRQILPKWLKHRIHSILYRFYITLIHTKATLNYRQLQLEDSDWPVFSLPDQTLSNQRPSFQRPHTLLLCAICLMYTCKKTHLPLIRFFPISKLLVTPFRGRHLLSFLCFIINFASLHFLSLLFHVKELF